MYLVLLLQSNRQCETVFHNARTRTATYYLFTVIITYPTYTTTLSIVVLTQITNLMLLMCNFTLIYLTALTFTSNSEVERSISETANQSLTD